MKVKILALIFYILLISCTDELNPFGELKIKYILNCVIRDDTFQFVMLSRTYATSNFNPYSDSTGHSIQGAFVRICNGKDILAILKDTVIERSEGDKYKTPYRVYYTNNF